MEGEISDHNDEYHESKEDLTSASGSESVDEDQGRKHQNRVVVAKSGLHFGRLPLPTSIPNSRCGRITLVVSRIGGSASSSKLDSRT